MLKCILWFFLLSIAGVLIFKWLPIPFTPLMGIRFTEQLFSKEKVRFKKDWVPLHKISRNLPLAMVASEDQLFTEHSGFDINAIEKAFENNNKKKKKGIKGASTISQQTAKNVFLWPGRSWIRKGFEVYFTILIEFIWGKERIMEVYLNVIEMGPGVYGAEAASQHYFKKKSEKLRMNESALIAAILPNPLKWSASKPSGYIQKRQNWIIRNMNNLGKVELETPGEKNRIP